MEPESWVSGGGKEIAARVAAVGEMSCLLSPTSASLSPSNRGETWTYSMHAIEPTIKIALHCILKRCDVIRLGDQIHGLLICTPLRGYPRRDVALETTWIVLRAWPIVGLVGLLEGVGHRAKVYGHAESVVMDQI
jgi:hypothetical protein